jgi:hypothetical protein
MDEAVDAAVDWWARQLDHPQFQNGGNANADWSATMLSYTRKPLSEEAIDQFRVHLRSLIKSRMAETRMLIITTDYHPDQLLTVALNAAGIDHGDDRLPIKTEMAIEKHKVRVAQGRDAKLRRIFPTK